jgi:hypothetical protein
VNVEMRPIGSILPYEHNNKKHPSDQIDKIARSIKEFGFNVPILVDEHNVIIAGHGRLLAAKQLCLTEVPIIVLTKLTTAQILQYRIADNKSAESEWDIEALKYEFGELQKLDLDMTATGFSMDEINKILGVETEEIEADDPDTITTDIQVGDVFQIGSHRLMCGDSANAANVAVLMNDKKAQVSFTDPPWNVNYGATKNPRWKKRSIENDNLGESFLPVMQAWFDNYQQNMVPGAMLYVAMSAQEWGVCMQVLEEKGFHWSSTIIWVKDRLVLSRKDYHTQYEPIWYGWLGDSRICPLEDRKQSDVWNIPRPQKSDEHPTMKPVELCARARSETAANLAICVLTSLADQAAQWLPANSLVGCAT